MASSDVGNLPRWCGYRNRPWPSGATMTRMAVGGLPPVDTRQPLPSFALFWCLLHAWLAQSMCTTRASVRIADGGPHGSQGGPGLCTGNLPLLRKVLPIRGQSLSATRSGRHCWCRMPCRCAQDQTHGTSGFGRLIAMFEDRRLCVLAA